MATIKSYTDLEQSRKLANILPLESADMIYTMVNGYHTPFVRIEKVNELDEDDICAWSLASLLEQLPYQVVNANEEDLTLRIEKEELQYYLHYENEYTGDSFELETNTYDDLIDACYELILKLNELKML